jgi:hypothetical protein
MSDGGKGSGLRPSSVPRSVVEENWDRIFGKKNADDQKKPVEETVKQSDD